MNRPLVASLALFLLPLVASTAPGQAPATRATAPPTPSPTTPPTTAATPRSPGASELKDLRSKASYGLGIRLSRDFKAQGVNLDPDLVLRGLKDGLGAGKPLLTDAELVEAMRGYQEQLVRENVEKNEAYLVENKAKPGVVTLPSGLQYKVVIDGKGPIPKATDTATVHFEGRLINGAIFDSSYQKGKPEEYPVGKLIPGWSEAIQRMKVGSKWELVIPSKLAYGPNGLPPIPPSATLLFTVELLGIK